MTDDRWYVLPVNPEPWAVGPLDLLRRGGKLAPTMGRNQQVSAYQDAVREALAVKYGAHEGVMPYAPGYRLDFYFWRNMAEYRTEAGRKARNNEADATNMQKATEDALQGLLIGNDRDVISARSTVMDQGPEVNGHVVFHLQWGVSRYGLQVPFWDLPPEEVLSEVALESGLARGGNDNSWPPK